MIGRERYLQVAASRIVKLTIRVLRCRLNPGLQRFNAGYIGNNRAVFQSIFRLKRVFCTGVCEGDGMAACIFYLSFQKKFCIFRLLLTFKIMFRWSSKWELEFLLQNALRTLPISILLCSNSQRARGTLFFGYISKDAYKGTQDSRCRVRATWLLSTILNHENAFAAEHGRLLFGVLDCFTTLFSIVWLWFEMPILLSAPVDSGTVQLHFGDKFLDLSSGYRKCHLFDWGRQRHIFCAAFFFEAKNTKFQTLIINEDQRLITWRSTKWAS